MGIEEHSTISSHRSFNSTIMAGAGLLDFHRVAPATNRIVVGTPVCTTNQRLGQTTF